MFLKKFTFKFKEILVVGGWGTGKSPMIINYSNIEINFVNIMNYIKTTYLSL